MLPIIGLFVFYYTHYIEGTSSFIIPLSLSFLWIALSLQSGGIKKLLFNNVSKWWMVYLLLCVIMVMIGMSSTNLNFIISRLPYYLTPAIGYFVVKNYNRKEKVILLAAFFAVFLYNLIHNIIIGNQDSYIFEEQASTEASIKFSILMNLADTYFIMVGYLLIGVQIMFLLTIKKMGWHLFSILLIIPIAYYMLFQNTRGIAILLLFVELIGFIVAYYEPRNQRNRGIFYFTMTILLVLVLFFVFIPIMNWAIENVQSERLAKRLEDLLDLRLAGGNSNKIAEGSLAARLELAQTSLNTFLANPINMLMGIGDHTLSFGGDLRKSGIGSHSEFIDVLARYGLIGALIYWKIMTSLFKWFKKLTGEREVFKYVNIIFFVIIMSGFLNQLFLPKPLLFMYLVFPILIEIADDGYNYQKKL